MTLQWLLGWWNLIFIVPFLIAVVYLGVYTMTGLSFGDGHDASHDGSHDADHDVPTDGPDGFADGHDADHPVHDAHDVTHHDTSAAKPDLTKPDASSGKLGLGFSLASLVGVGRVPLSLVMVMLLVTWGLGGFITNQMLHDQIADGHRVGMLSLPIAAMIAIGATALLARVFGKVAPINERSGTWLRELVGRDGVAVLPISETFGLMKVHDASGVSVQVPCRVAPGQQPIAPNDTVRVMRFDRQERVFYVTTPDRFAAMNA